ncbi:MAG: sigma-70 family RNA polymerase sigma factor [archaeon]
MEKYSSAKDELREYMGRICPRDSAQSVHMTRDEERAETVKAKNGDMEAWGRLIQANIGIIVNEICKFELDAKIKRVSLCDVAGDFLLDAQKRFMRYFEPEKGYRFSTFVFQQKIIYPDIRESIKKCASGGLTHVSPTGALLLSLPQEGDDESDIDYMSGATASYHEMATLYRDLPTTVDFAEQRMDYSDLHKLVDGLSEREAFVVRRHYFEEATFEEIGKDMKLTRGAVHLINKSALKRLKTRSMKDINLEARLGGNKS